MGWEQDCCVKLKGMPAGLVCTPRPLCMPNQHWERSLGLMRCPTTA